MMIKSISRTTKPDVFECPTAKVGQIWSALRLARYLALAFGVFGLMAAPQSWAEPAPGKRDCGTPGTPGQDEEVYTRVKCKQEALVIQLEHIVDVNLTSQAVGRELSESQKKLMRSEKNRVKIVERQVKPENFKHLASGIRKNNQKSCQLVPLEGEAEVNANGICEPELGETCGADEDLTLACDTKLKRPHPNKPGLVCAQICDTEASQSEVEEEEELQVLAQDMEETYDALENSLIETNEVLDEVNVILASEAAVLKMASSDPCDNIDPLPVGLEESGVALRHIAGIAASVHDVTSALTRQTVVAVAVAAGFGGGGGGNASAAGAIVATVAGVAQEAYLIVDDIIGERRTKLQDNTFACLQQAVADIESVGGKVDASATMLGSKLDRNQDEIIAMKRALSEEMAQLRAALVELMNTPQGQRSNWPNP